MLMATFTKEEQGIWHVNKFGKQLDPRPTLLKERKRRKEKKRQKRRKEKEKESKKEKQERKSCFLEKEIPKYFTEMLKSR